MHKNIAETILSQLQTQKEILSTSFNEDIFPTLQMLASHQLINYKTIEQKFLELTTEGINISNNGSPEFNLYKKIKEGVDTENIKNEKIAIGHAFKNGWIEIKNENFFIKKEIEKDELKEILNKIKAKENSLEDKFQNLNLDTKTLQNLRKRKLIEENKNVFYKISKGDKYQPNLPNFATEITSQMISSSSYVNFTFKPYNFDTTGKIPLKGNLHPLLKVKDEFRKIFIALGFTEMNSANYVESSFWNFDVLFQPQQHPSRDSHDTFFVKDEVNLDCDLEYLHKVKEMHEIGDSESLGHMRPWDLDETKKGALRTHTTAISARYLYKIGQMLKGKKSELGLNDKIKIDNNECFKLFSIDKVFRNESIDATHLPEFHQIEGVIVGKNLHLSQLMGIIQTFFYELGMKNVKFKPAYNPYTEPSMEIFGFHEGLNKWIEIGNSGIFRPEMLKPMGFENDVKVFGWGLSVERPTMIMYGIKDIRDLVGHKVDFEFIKNSEICLFK
ncbi:Phenylalanyl-tRNA synthetase [Gurleya vavrai]